MTTAIETQITLQSAPHSAPIVLDVPLVPPAPLPDNDRTIMTIGVPDARRVDYHAIRGLEVPLPRTRTLKSGDDTISYQPVAFCDVADTFRSVISAELGVLPESECYALARFDRETDQPAQGAGKIVWPWDGKHLEAAVLWSRDSSLAIHGAIGLHTRACANGMVSGESMIKLKQTANVGERLPAMISEIAGRAERTVRELREKMARWSSVACGTDMFFALLGVLQGRGEIDTPTANAARKYWQACRDGSLHAEHAADNLANAMQALTGAFQRVSPSRLYRAHASADTVIEAFARSGGSPTDIPNVSLNVTEFE